MEAKNEHANLAASEGINMPQSSNADNNGGELEKIRAILFGEQIRSTEDRLANLEEQLMAKMAEAHEAIESRLDALEKKLDGSTKDLQKELKSQKRDIELDLKKMDDALRETIVSAASTVAHDFETKTDALSQALEDSLGQLQKEKVNRAQLSDILAQLAKSLEG